MKLFVYGTLLFPEIVKSLTGEKPEYYDGSVDDFKVVSLKNVPYPGLIKLPGDVAIGKVIEISEPSYKTISDWEDNEYTATEVTLKSGERAMTFVHNKPELWLKTPWVKKYFEKNYLELYIKTNIPNFLKTKF